MVSVDEADSEFVGNCDGEDVGDPWVRLLDWLRCCVGEGLVEKDAVIDLLVDKEVVRVPRVLVRVIDSICVSDVENVVDFDFETVDERDRDLLSLIVSDGDFVDDGTPEGDQVKENERGTVGVSRVIESENVSERVWLLDLVSDVVAEPVELTDAVKTEEKDSEIVTVLVGDRKELLDCVRDKEIFTVGLGERVRVLVNVRLSVLVRGSPVCVSVSEKVCDSVVVTVTDPKIVAVRD